MEVKSGPNSADNPNLLYKLQRKIKIFNTNNTLCNRGYNLVACTSKYGIVFVASPFNGAGVLSVYNVKQLIDKECKPPHLLIKLQVSPTHISVNCNQEWLAVIGGQMLLVYKCVDFQNPEARPSVALKCDVNPSTFVSSFQWNPCIADTIGIVFFDGTLLVSQVSNMQVKKIQSKARCLCWSPKGKQLVTGNSDGSLTQYKPDLSQMKSVPTPNLFEGAPVEVLAIYWIATYQFAVAYRNASNNSRPAVTIVNTPKGGTSSCVNYEDICYSMGSNRPWYYYLQGIAQWNMLLTSSANSMEIATLATSDGSNWVQWCQTDEGRAELPLTNKKQESYPVGICIDTAAAHQIPWGENEMLPPMPMMHVISHTGWLTIFNIINLNKTMQQLCTPIQPLTLPITSLTIYIPDDVPAQPQAPAVQTQQQPQIKVQPVQQVQSVQRQPEQVKPFSVLTQPAVQPTQTGIQLLQPTVQPSQPTMQPSQPSQPTVQPSQPTMQPSQPTMQPSQPTMQPSQPTVQPPQPVMQLLPTMLQTQSQVQPVVNQPTKPLSQAPASSTDPRKYVKATLPASKPQPIEMTAAMKLEQEKISKAKADQELKKILVKEVNDFQMELYNFMKITQDRHQKFQQEIQVANLTMEIDMDAERLRKECEVEGLRETVIQLKLELVRTCAAVAEAKTHADVKGHLEWTQMDPLTAKRIATVKKLSYYVQNQLDQAQKALDHKWNEINAREQYQKSGHRMIRPILDDVYQPLVKQQEILVRQQAVIKSLKNTMKEYNITPSLKSTSLLRSTPFRNKDPLSKLTKNILNMSIEPQNKAKEQLLNSQKLDALRDVLSNHKPIKIKPVSVEVTQHLENMKKKYEESVQKREKQRQALNALKTVEKIEMLEAKQENPAELYPKPQLPLFTKEQVKEASNMNSTSFNQNVPQIRPNLQKTHFKQPAPTAFSFTQPAVSEVKPDISKESPINTNSFFKPPPPVARTLFTSEHQDEKPKEITTKPVQLIQQPVPEQNMAASQNTKSLLRQYILKDSNVNLHNKDKNDANTFMGQQICSPTNLQTPIPSPNLITSKPIADLANVFAKYQTDPATGKPKSDETGEPETGISKEKPKENKPITNMFSLKTSTPSISRNQNAPDLVKGGEGFAFSKIVPKADDTVKETDREKLTNSEKNAKKEELKPSVAPMTSKEPSQSVIIVDLKKPAAEAKIEKLPSPVFSGASAAPLPASSMPQQGFVAVPAAIEITLPDCITKTETSIPNSTAADSDSTASVTVTLPKPKDSECAKVTRADTQPENLSYKSTVTTTSESKPPETSNVTNTNTSMFSSFGQSKPGLALGTSTSQSSTSSTSSSQSIFASQTQASTTSIFGTSSAQSIFSAAASKSAFGATTTQSSAVAPNSVFTTSHSTPSQGFGTSTQRSIFATTTNPAPVFGSQTQTTQASVFAGATDTTQASVFAGATATTQASVFTGATATTQATVFTGATATTQASVFAGATATTQASVFTGATATTQASVFATPAQTTQASVFATPAQTTQASVFTTPAQTTQASVFATPAQTTQASVFGSPIQRTQSSIFGTPTQTSQTSIFGSPSQTTQVSAFGAPTQTNQASIFGTPAATTQASVFGTPTTTQASMFGTGESDLFASASISATSAPSPTSGGSIFGGSSGSAFGSNNTNVFGGKTNFSNTNSTASSIFGGASQTFGSKPDFWNGGTNSSGFGQQAAAQSSPMFGSSGGFSTPNAQPFGTPAFSGENKTFAQQQTAPAFGGSPVFESKPAFGGSPGFGAPAFGGFNKTPNSGFGAPAAFGGGGFGAPAFGNTSPGKMFGNNAPGFGSPTQSNSTFETLATQNTVTFGNLAQQSGQPAPQPPTFNTSPSFTGWRG